MTATTSRDTSASRQDFALAVACLAFVIALLGCESEEGLCTAGPLQTELDAAQPGDRVFVGACTVAGALRVPVGVTLEGQGQASSTIELDISSAPVTIETGDIEGGLANLTIRSAGCAAVTARGQGAVSLSSVHVEATSGIAIGVENADSVTMTDVIVTGPITADTPDSTIESKPEVCRTDRVATHGIVLVDVTNAALTRVEVSAFGAFGALFLRSGVTWEGGGSENNVGTGVGVWGGEVDLRNLRLCGAQQRTLTVEANNGIFADGASVSTSQLTVCESEVFGLFHQNASAEHMNLTASDNGYAGVWAQNVTALTIAGSSNLSRNAVAGVAAFDSPNVQVSGAVIEGTESKLTLVGQTGSAIVGDGVHAIRSEGTLDGLLLTNNERAALLLDFGGEGQSSAFTISDTVVDATGDALGAIAQNGTIAADWDANITRRGATAANDAQLATPLPVSDIVGPVCLPNPGELEVQGLSALIDR